MTDESAFLEAVRAAPKDRATRLVYADWLEERGDPNGELIRIEEESAELPVFSDRFWLLKPRRNELRSRAAPDWLAAMRYGTDCQPVFRHGVPGGLKERWRLIREYTERWYGIPLGDVGGRADEIREAEARLGRLLPASLREWVAFTHDAGHWYNETRFVLRDVDAFYDLGDELSALSLLVQCEGDYHWAIRHADLHLPDPAVYGFIEDSQAEQEGMFVPDRDKPLADTLSRFVLEYAVANTRGRGGGFHTGDALPEQLIRDLQGSFPVRLDTSSPLRDIDGEAMEVFEDDNILVCLSRGTREYHISVQVARPLPHEAIPAFLWDLTHGGGAFGGMFERQPPAERRRRK
jgi:uncharacterized protein (TIGR02996 family)